MANKVAESISREEFFYGHKACAGCGGSLAVRAALKVLGPNAVSVLPAALLLKQFHNLHICRYSFHAHRR